MSNFEDFLVRTLAKRQADGLYRRLVDNSQLIDLCSNDYLGFSRSKTLANSIKQACESIDTIKIGATGSRLLNGNSYLAEELEQFIAQYHQSGAALLFNSGYDANVGLFSSVPQRGDTIIYDELIHASIHDGRRLSKADSFQFLHNDLTHLEERLKAAKGNTFVAVESIYSMDGDAAPVPALVTLCKQYGAHLIIDEAHATGCFGPNGAGLVAEYGLEKEVFARIHTYGKALGCHGAAVLGSKRLREYLINYARPLIYSTALPYHSLISIRCAYVLLAQSKETVHQLRELITYFKNKLNNHPTLVTIPSNSAIQCIIIQGNEETRSQAYLIQQVGLDVRAILSPTVPKGKERLRVCLHAFNTTDEIDRLFDVLSHTAIS